VERQALHGSPRCTPRVERSWRGALPPSGARQRRRGFAGEGRRVHVAGGGTGGVDTTRAWPRLRSAVHHLERCLAMGAASLEPRRLTLTSRAMSVASARAAASTNIRQSRRGPPRQARRLRPAEFGRTPGRGRQPRSEREPTRRRPRRPVAVSVRARTVRGTPAATRRPEPPLALEVCPRLTARRN
jgi:hypothetical protein